jgi:Holliday junction resolvase RusA-like endonuclease
MKKYKFIIEGVPLTKDNTKIYNPRTGKFFLPKKLKQYEEYVKWQILQQKPKDFKIIENPVSLQLNFYFPDYKKRDVLNYTKSLCDALSGLVYKDDSLIETANIQKFVDKKNPRVEIKVEEIDKEISWIYLEKF